MAFNDRYEARFGTDAVMSASVAGYSQRASSRPAQPPSRTLRRSVPPRSRSLGRLPRYRPCCGAFADGDNPRPRGSLQCWRGCSPSLPCDLASSAPPAPCPATSYPRTSDHASYAGSPGQLGRFPPTTEYLCDNLGIVRSTRIRQPTRPPPKLQTSSNRRSSRIIHQRFRPSFFKLYTVTIRLDSMSGLAQGPKINGWAARTRQLEGGMGS